MIAGPVGLAPPLRQQWLLARDGGKEDSMRSNRPRSIGTLASGALATLLFLFSPTSSRAQEELQHWPGQSNIRFSLGEFAPDGSSSYWEDKEIDFTGSTDELADITLDIDYIYYWTERFGALVSMGGWQGKQTQSYRDFVDLSGRDISHLTTVEGVWLDFGLVFHLFDRRRAIMPYVGAGGSVVFWELSEEGEFIDFDRSPPEVFNDAFFADGDAFGWFFLVGLEVPVSDSVALFAEGRWRRAEDELGSDFAGFGTLDLSGRSITGGVSFVF